MKNYRMLVPVGLVVIMTASIFSFVGEKQKTKNNYSAYVQAAQKCIKDKLYVDAINYYNAAYNIQPSVELNKTIIDCYQVQGNNVDRMYEELLENYPKDKKSYEYAVEYYIEQKEYELAYDVRDTAIKRKVDLGKITEMMDVIKYYYKLSDNDYIEIFEFYNDYAVVKSESEKYGAVNSSGGSVRGCTYQKISSYSEQMFSVVTDEGECYWIDLEGNKRKHYDGIEKVTELGPISNGIYWGKLEDGRYAFYNSQNKKISEAYEEVTNFSDGVGAVFSGSWYLVDSTMKMLDEMPYTLIIQNENGYISNSERLFVAKGGSYQMIDITGKIVTDDFYEDAKLFVDGTAAAVKKDGKWGFINTKGEMVITPEYEDARSFSNGYAAVKKDGKWGFINTKGEMIIEPIFEDTKDFSSTGNVYVFHEGKWNLLSFYS